MIKITEHFSLEEFSSPARRGFQEVPYPAQWVESRLNPLCSQLEIIREALGGKSITILSGYRTPEYNAAIGGAKLSQHKEGRAADIYVAGVEPKVVHDSILDLCKTGKLPSIKGLGYYPGFTHVDIRPSSRLVRWSGSRPTDADKEG